MDDSVTVGRYVVMKDRLYTPSDEYVKVEGNVAVVGITDYAQKKLRDIVGVDLPEEGRAVGKGEVVATVESVKAAADIYAPLSGRVIQVNEELRGSPELINADPYRRGWILKVEISNRDEIEKLMKWEEYVKKIEKE